MVRMSRRAALWRRIKSAAGPVVTVSLISVLVMIGLPRTTALFTGDYPKSVTIAASRIFRAERTTPAFAVSDVSSGSAADRSSSTAYGSDGRYFVSRAWSSTFSSTRYLEVDLNAPLPAGLAVSNASLTLRLASDAGTGSLCVYVELRRASNGALLSTHGSSGSPLACTSGSSYSTLNIPVAAVSTTDIANDLRVRVFASDSASGAMRLDRAVLVADTPYTTFTLYPTLTREAFSGQTEVIPWGLAAQ